jgi:hypothetical protein
MNSTRTLLSVDGNDMKIDIANQAHPSHTVTHCLALRFAIEGPCPPIPPPPGRGGVLYNVHVV